MSTSRRQITAPGAISRQQSNRSVEEQNLERLFGTNSEDEHEKSETDEPNSVEEVNDEPENTAPNVEEIEKELAEQLLNLNLEETDRHGSNSRNNQPHHQVTCTRSWIL